MDTRLLLSSIPPLSFAAKAWIDAIYLCENHARQLTAFILLETTCMRHRSNLPVVLALLLSVLTACGGDNPEGPMVDPAIAPFVGTWEAEVFTVTSVADPSIVADLIEIGGSFTVNIQPSGTYTATLVFSDGDISVPLVEIGTLGVAGNFITLRPNGGDPATSQYTFVREDYLRLEGPTEFDFNFDDEPDPADAFIEIQRRGS